MNVAHARGGENLGANVVRQLAARVTGAASSAFSAVGGGAAGVFGTVGLILGEETVRAYLQAGRPAEARRQALARGVSLPMENYFSGVSTPYLGEGGGDDLLLRLNKARYNIASPERRTLGLLYGFDQAGAMLRDPSKRPEQIADIIKRSLAQLQTVPEEYRLDYANRLGVTRMLGGEENVLSMMGRTGPEIDTMTKAFIASQKGAKPWEPAVEKATIEQTEAATKVAQGLSYAGMAAIATRGDLISLGNAAIEAAIALGRIVSLQNAHPFGGAEAHPSVPPVGGPRPTIFGQPAYDAAPTARRPAFPHTVPDRRTWFERFLGFPATPGNAAWTPGPTTAAMGYANDDTAAWMKQWFQTESSATQAAARGAEQRDTRLARLMEWIVRREDQGDSVYRALLELLGGHAAAARSSAGATVSLGGGGGGGGFGGALGAIGSLVGGVGGAVGRLLGGGRTGGAAGGAGGGSIGGYTGSLGKPGWWTPERQQHAIDYLQKNAGLSEMGAKGLVARWAYVEATGGPGSVNPSSGARGIEQALGSRAAGMPGDFEGQLAWAAKELNTTEAAAARYLRAAKTPEEAAIAATRFERAAGYNPRTGIDAYTGKTLAAINQMGGGGAGVPATGGGKYTPLSATPGRHPDVANVDPRLNEIMGAAASHLPPGYKVTVNEGYNPYGHVSASQHHIKGRGALDLQIIDPSGRVIPNEGGDPTGMYTQLAQGAYGEMLARHPELKGRLAWGGAFGASNTNPAADLMHFDIGGERGRRARLLSVLGALPNQKYGVQKPTPATLASIGGPHAGGPLDHRQWQDPRAKNRIDLSSSTGSNVALALSQLPGQ
jgi:hypothetical protein